MRAWLTQPFTDSFNQGTDIVDGMLLRRSGQVKVYSSMGFTVVLEEGTLWPENSAVRSNDEVPGQYQVPQKMGHVPLYQN